MADLVGAGVQRSRAGRRGAVEAIAAGDWRLFFLQRDRARKATLGDVQKAATSYLVQSNRIEGRYLPTENRSARRSAQRVDLSEVFKDYKGDPDFKSASAFDPSPANIDKLTLRKKLDLPNGPVQLALLPKATRGNRVQAQMQIQFGTAQDLRGQRVNAAAVADQLNRGTAKLSRQDIQDRLDKLQAELGFSGSGTTLRIAMSTKGENLPELTTLALDIVRNANFPKDQLEYQRQLETSIRNAMTEPSALASRALARQDNPWPADDLRYVPTFDEALASARGLNRDALAKFHARFYGAGNIEYSAVGDFSPRPSRRPSRPAWPAGNARPPMSAWQIRTARSPRSADIETPDKANAFYLSRMPLKLQDSDADYAALYLANYLFGASETSRLWNRVRETEGLSYNVRSSLSVSAFEPNASWSIYAIYAPQNRERLERPWARNWPVC